MTARCVKCGQEWPRDPRLEVPCPTCGAAIGRSCKRPSGHVAPEPHVPREQAAIDAGHLTAHCPAEPQAGLFEVTP